MSMQGVEHGVLKVDDGGERRRRRLVAPPALHRRRRPRLHAQDVRSFGPLDPAIHHEGQVRCFARWPRVARSRSTLRWCYRRGGASATPATARSRRRGPGESAASPRDRRARAAGRDSVVAGCADAVTAARLRFADYLRRLYDADSALGLQRHCSWRRPDAGLALSKWLQASTTGSHSRGASGAPTRAPAERSGADHVVGGVVRQQVEPAAESARPWFGPAQRSRNRRSSTPGKLRSSRRTR